ncbi:hypothetical protein BC830DRAFT_786252 [Chytriomyces sp. MP71]|nr:hypothetical protein BC830DRAFT_786252 [Chytriomyces sp. MP71]
MLEGDDVSRRRSSSVRGGEFDVDRTAGIGLVVAAAPLQAQQGPASIAAASGLFGAGRLASGSGIVSGVPVTSSRFVEATKFAGVEDILKPVGTTAKTATKDIRAQKKESTVTEAMRAEATIKSAMLSAQVRQRTPSRLIESGVLADFLHNVEGILGPISSEKNGAPNGRGKGAKESGSIAVPDPPPTLPAAVLTATKPVDMLKDKPSLPTVPSNKDLFEIMLKEKRAQRYQGFLDIMGKKTGLPRSEAEKQTFEMQKVNPTRELDVIFMRDFTFLEKRVTDTQINELNQKVIRDMNVFGSIFIRPVKWPALEEMIFNYFRFLRAQRTALIESDLASALVEVVEDDLSMDNILLEFRRLIRQLPRLAALKLKMNFIYLERLATVLEDIPAPLYPGISNLFATLFFRFPNRKNKLHELEKRHGSRANSDFHRSISQTFANEFGSMNSVQNSLTQLRTTSITESVSISIEYPVSERDTVSVKPSGGLLPINSLGGLSPTTSNIPSKHTRRQTSKKFVKGLWVDVESESQNNYGVETYPLRVHLHPRPKKSWRKSSTSS